MIVDVPVDGGLQRLDDLPPDADAEEREALDEQRDTLDKTRVTAAKNAAKAATKLAQDALGSKGTIIDVIVEEVREA